jgi:hypothetical protein
LYPGSVRSGEGLQVVTACNRIRLDMRPRSVRVPDPGTQKVVRALSRLDPWSFWRTPEEGGMVLVVGLTGAWAVSACGATGELTSLGGRVKVGGQVVRLRELKRMAREARTRLDSASVDVKVQPIVCCTDAHIGQPKNVAGVRFLPVGALVKDLTDRDRILPLARAQKAAKALGMREIAETA